MLSLTKNVAIVLIDYLPACVKRFVSLTGIANKPYRATVIHMRHHGCL